MAFLQLILSRFFIIVELFMKKNEEIMWDFLSIYVARFCKDFVKIA